MDIAGGGWGCVGVVVRMAGGVMMFAAGDLTRYRLVQKA
jgi:hypothetical protein